MNHTLDKGRKRKVIILRNGVVLLIAGFLTTGLVLHFGGYLKELQFGPMMMLLWNPCGSIDERASEL